MIPDIFRGVYTVQESQFQTTVANRPVVKRGREQAQSFILRTQTVSWRHRPGQSDLHRAASLSHTVSQLNRPTVSLADLAREYESDTASSWFCRVKGNEYVARIHESRTVVLNGENQVFVGQLPSQDDLRLRLAGV